MLSAESLSGPEICETRGLIDGWHWQNVIHSIVYLGTSGDFE
jgi:hypothetical protein